MINEIGYLKSKNILKNINHGDNLIIVNGRVIRDVSNSDETLFELIEGYERTVFGQFKTWTYENQQIRKDNDGCYIHRKSVHEVFSIIIQLLSIKN